MSWRSTTTRTPIGLDVGARWIHAAQLTGRPGAWRLAAATAVPREADGCQISPDEITRLMDVMGRQGFSGRDAVLAVPQEKLISAILELPPRDSGAPVAQIARMELASMHRLDPAALELSYWDLPETSRQRESSRVMAAACMHGDADEYLNLFESRGLNITALDTSSAAVARVCDLSGASRQEIVPVLDLGWRSARLALLYQDVIIYERQLTDAGINMLWQGLAARLEIEAEVTDYLLNEVGLRDGDEAAETPQLGEIHTEIREHFEDAVRELGVSFSYALHQYNDAVVGPLSLVGGGAAIPGLAEHLASELGMKVHAATPALYAERGQILQKLGGSPALCQAMGLALHGRGGAAA
ncbi:pilus assembly protein PilM [Planctomycetales bacterium ZRK34]|nr:pilus assembly protein PilM [Planctomycetales bacterium ZRK34]